MLMIRRRPSIAGLLTVLILVVGCSGRDESGNSKNSTSDLHHTIVFTRSGQVYRIGLDGTGEQAIHTANDAALLSPDGKLFADFAPGPDGRDSVAVFNVDGSGYRALPIPDPSLRLPGGWWLGSSRVVAEGMDPSDPSRTGIYSRRASDGGDLRRLTEAGAGHHYPIKSSPDGSKLLLFQPADDRQSDSSPQDLYVVNADGTALTRLTPAGTTTAVVHSFDSVSWSPDGTKVAVAAAMGNFWKNKSRSVCQVNADGSGFACVGPKGDVWDAVWSPDGQWIAFTMVGESAGKFELFLMHPDGSGMHALVSASDGQFSLHPAWSADSKQILIVRGKDMELMDLWAVSVDGSQLHQVTHVPAGYWGLAWLA